MPTQQTATIAVGSHMLLLGACLCCQGAMTSLSVRPRFRDSRRGQATTRAATPLSASIWRAAARKASPESDTNASSTARTLDSRGLVHATIYSPAFNRMAATRTS